METTIQMEYHCLLWSLVLGVFIYGIYEIFRIVRRLFLNSFLVCFVCDLLFMTLSGFAVFAFSLGFSSGIVRWYTLFAGGAAFLVCRGTVGILTGKIYDKIFCFGSKLCNAIKNFFQKFIKTLLKNMNKMLYNIVKVYRKIFLSKGKR